MTETTIACHDGWNLYVYASTGCLYDRAGVPGVSLTRGVGALIDVPHDDIPDLIAALQALYDAREDGAGR